MLNICLLTVEDTSPAEIYTQIYDALRDWLFVRKGIVRLQQPETDDHRWVTNLADWRRVLPHLTGQNDLVFCTVDLSIPDDATGQPDAQNGLTIVHEIQMRQEDGLRCCILTGLGAAELETLSVPNVLFDFKGDSEQGFPNIVSYIKSQVLAMIPSVEFPGTDDSPQIALLQEESGRLRDQFLSKASYYADEATWHVPSLLISEKGLGCETFLRFIAHLADAKFTRIDLGSSSVKNNRENHARLEALLEEIDSVMAGKGGSKQLFYVAGLDDYQPGVNTEASENCLWPLRTILKRLVDWGGKQSASLPIGIAFSVSGESRLRIRSRECRGFIRFLEECIGEMASFPLRHLAMDQNGWIVDHPKILRIPSLEERGEGFVPRVIDSRMKLFDRLMTKRLPGYKGQPLSLEDDVKDLLADKTDWAQHRNLSGLVRELDIAFERFLTNRSATQFEVTRAHLSEQATARLRRTVLNMDDVTLEFPQGNGSKLLVIEKADFHVDDGELLVILGPSGSGKSTILRLLAGLLPPTSGTVSYRGERVEKPSERIGMIFQDYSLFPWLTVRRNIEFGPRLRGLKPAEIGQKVDKLLEIAKLKGFEDAYPHQLSGGMRQRVAIVRSIANDSDVLLMDEPFGALDVQTRWQMQDFLIQTKKQTRKTIVFVTHDLDEAVYLADRIYVASPRPLKLGHPLPVPFALADRKDSLRRDAIFVAMVTRVREVLLSSVSKALIENSSANPH